MYKILKHSFGETLVKIDGDSMTSIPYIEGNRDYQEYLEWLAEGNTPEPADE